MAREDSMKKVLVGLSLQSDRYEREEGPAKQFIIPASQALLDAPRKYSELRGEASQHLIGVVPLAYNTKMSLGIFAFPEKSGLGELLAMAIGEGVVGVLTDGVYEHTFTPQDVPPLATIWQKEQAGELCTWSAGANKLTIDVPNNSEMKVTADILGAGIMVSSDMGTPNAENFPGPCDGSKVFRSGKLTLTYGDSGDAIRVNVKDVKIEIDRGIKIEDGQCQDMDYPLTVVPSQNLLTADIEFLQEDLVELRRSWGGKTVTSPQSIVGCVAANLKYVGPAIVTQPTAYYYTLEIDIPAAHIKYTPIEKGERRAGRITLSPVAAPGESPYTITLVNTVETAYKPAGSTP
jgi:hypothetical protein